jgi:hypothetical protein
MRGAPRGWGPVRRRPGAAAAQSVPRAASRRCARGRAPPIGHQPGRVLPPRWPPRRSAALAARPGGAAIVPGASKRVGAAHVQDAQRLPVSGANGSDLLAGARRVAAGAVGPGHQAEELGALAGRHAGAEPGRRFGVTPATGAVRGGWARAGRRGGAVYVCSAAGAARGRVRTPCGLPWARCLPRRAARAGRAAAARARAHFRPRPASHPAPAMPRASWTRRTRRGMHATLGAFDHSLPACTARPIDNMSQCFPAVRRA